MGFVYREKGKFGGAQQAAEAFAAGAFGGDIEEVEITVAQPILAARMPTACAARSWSCIRAMSGEMTTQQPSSATAGSW
jgi:hypothetical protein